MIERLIRAWVLLMALGGLVYCSSTDSAGGGDEPESDAGNPDGSTGNDAPASDGLVFDSSTCTPKTCAQLGVDCGQQGDGCGKTMDCGSCTAPACCGCGGVASKCGTGPCTPKTCAELNASCGMQGDGCGNLIDCGTCTPPQACGGGGTQNVCGGGCTSKTCAQMGYDCGPVADGCGGLAQCGTCTVAGEICGGGGKPNVCGNAIPPCVKKTCASAGANCGPVSDGCGGLTQSCGTCSGTEICGGAGVPSQCGGPAPCVKKTCTDYPGTCGPQPDGCGGVTASCGSCTAPQVCGGGGTPGVCGGAPLCVKKTCADYPGKCGPQPDGCGGLTVSCGSCTSPQTCGGGGTPSQCGAPPACVPKTCASAPAGTCGPISDGCGGLTANCGACVAPEICGGGGIPSKCGGGGGTQCVNLQCKQVACPSGGTTSISGVVYDPAGLRPLPNVNVYVPNGTVAPITSGATCNQCSAGLSGFPLVKTTTDVKGQFTLTNMPVGANIPVVIQLGKWRRQISVTTTQCANVVVAPGLSRLPRNKSEGDIPKVAVATGGADALECLLRKIGIDDGEFTNPSGSGRVHLFAGGGSGANPATTKYHASLNGGASFPNATQLWNQTSQNLSANPPIYGLGAYDVVLLNCEALSLNTSPNYLYNKSTAARTAMQDYVNAGGRVFGSHYHYAWMRESSVLPAPYNAWASMVTWNTTNVTLSSPTQETVLTTFPKALMMSNWMQVTPPPPATPWATVVPPAPAPSRFPVYAGRRAVVSLNDANIFSWIQTVTNAYEQYFSFDTPVGVTPACGRFVFSDIHVASGNSPGGAFPNDECTSPTSMSAQEGALEFMFFDLASPVCGGTPPPPTCTPITCAAQGIQCGAAPDGCGGTLACGTCTAPLVCSTGGQCAGSSCVPANCAGLGYSCGSWADGCGGSVDCGTCSSGTCGGGGVPGKCGGASCTPTTCSALGYDCGSWPDGCGGTLSCGTCVAPLGCGGGGVPGKCGGTTCTPATCASLGYTCGAWADGCGGTLACGTCTAPETCGGSGVPGTCGTTSCTKKTCAEMGVPCGLSGDGCGGTMDCGPCGGPTCTPLGCGGRCGPQGDGCGGVLQCEACPPGACVPTTCAKAGATCGFYPDGCGVGLDCGTCATGQVCSNNKCLTIG